MLVPGDFIHSDLPSLVVDTTFGNCFLVKKNLIKRATDGRFVQNLKSLHRSYFGDIFKVKGKEFLLCLSKPGHKRAISRNTLKFAFILKDKEACYARS